MTESVPTDFSTWLQAEQSERVRWAESLLHLPHADALAALVEAAMTATAPVDSPPSPQTLITYRKGIRALCLYLVEQSKSLPTPTLEQDYVDWMQSKGRTAMTIRTRVAALRQIRSAFQWAEVRQKMFGRARQLPDYKSKQGKRAFSEIEIAKLLQHAYIEEGIVLLLSLELGLKPNEISRLRPNDLNLGVPATLHIKDQSGDWVLPISNDLRDLLARWLSGRETEYVLPGRGVNHVATLVERACHRAGVSYTETGTDGLRLSAGARHYKQTGDPEAVRRFLRLRSRANLKPYLIAASKSEDSSSQ